MTVNGTQVRLAPNGAISVAPYGTTLPTDESMALNVAFKDLGYASTEGVTLTPGVSTTDIKAWQSKLPVKIVLTDISLEAKFTLLQTNRDTVSLYFFGGAWTVPTSGHAKLAMPSTPSLLEYSLVIDWVDEAANKYRQVIDRAVISARDGLQLQQADATKFGLTFRGLDNAGNFGTLYSNDADLVNS